MAIGLATPNPRCGSAMANNAIMIPPCENACRRPGQPIAKTGNSRQVFQAGFADFPQGLEMLQQQFAPGRADAADVFQGETRLAFSVKACCGIGWQNGAPHPGCRSKDAAAPVGAPARDPPSPSIVTPAGQIPPSTWMRARFSGRRLTTSPAGVTRPRVRCRSSLTIPATGMPGPFRP